jgi:hypothetical protein
VQAKLKLENDAKAAAAEYAARQAELLAVSAAKAAADAESTAAAARSDALDATAKTLSDVASSTGDYAEAAAAAQRTLEEANRQSRAGADAAAAAQAEATAAQARADKTLSDQRAAEADAARAIIDAAAATKAAADAAKAVEAAAAARAAAEAAGKPQPMTDREYLLLVAAAKSEAENAAIKKAAEDKAKQDADKAEDKAKQDADKAAAEAEKAATAQKNAADPNQVAIDAARKKADEAKAESERFAAKAQADIAAADAKAAAAIEAAKKKAQQIIDGITSNLNKLAAKASQIADKYRNQANNSSDKADAATSAMKDAKDKEIRTSEIAAALATDLKTVTNQVVQIQTKVKDVVAQEKTFKQAIAAKQQDLDSSIKQYEKTRIDIATFVATYNSVKSDADAAAQFAAEMKDAATRSKVIADNATDAYRSAAGMKNLISTEKPFTVESADTGANVQTTASAADIAKLKQLADQAVVRYNQNQRAADIAAKVAEKAFAQFQQVKKVLEAKVVAGKALQTKIRNMQDDLAAYRQKLAVAVDTKNQLISKLRSTQSIVTTKLNDLTVAQVEAQKAKVIADKAALAVKQYRTDASNADKVATANEDAIEAAKAAAIAVSDSSNSIDKIVASNAFNNSIASLPMIFSAVAVVAAAVFFGTLAIRRHRRRGSAPLPAFTEPDLDVQFDFDRILAEIRMKEVKRQARASKREAASKTVTVRKATPKKAAPKKR